ncbi:hypothetical protein LPJ66_006138 [Kickxella alabastrina]|uniref:Uncharacterized protein n=1 Tax=Kickxella alabastrina TaxID=61397 RepID=A0ACC1IGA7_9FUNG|nr:hypothetical protein LPJ66_006138 [Kickxella alabastrina]
MPNTPNFRSSAVPGTPNFHSSAMPSMHSTRNSAVPGTPAMPGSAVSGTLDEPSSAVPSSAMPSSLPGSNSNASSPSTPVATGPVGPFTPMIPMFATTPTLPEAPMYVGTPVFLSPADTPFMPTMLATANSVVQSGTFMTPNPRYSRAPPAYTLIPSDSAPVTGGIQTPGRTDIHVTLPDSTLTSNIISETNVAGNSAGTVPLTSEEQEFADWRKVKMTLIKELEKGGVIMIVDLPEHARIAQETGATAVMVIENKETHKYDRQRMTAPRIVQKVIDIVALPVIAQVRLGHTMEARAMEKLGVNLIDECSELGVVNSANQIDKRKFTTPFMCSAEDLPTAVKRIKEGASIIYSKAERDSGDPTDAIGTIKGIHDQIKLLRNSSEAEIDDYARQEEVDSVILNQTIQLNRLPVPFFASGGINTPVDVAHVRRAGCDGVIASTIIFKGLDPVKRAAAIVSACKNFNDNKLIGELSKDFKQAQIE